MASSITHRDESFCLDVVQDAMLRVVRHMKPLPDHAALRRWLHRVVRTAALDLLKAERRREQRHRHVAASDQPSPDPAAVAERNDLIAAISAELQRRSADDRSMLIHRFALGLTLRESGGTSKNATHGRLRRLLARLRHISGKQT